MASSDMDVEEGEVEETLQAPVDPEEDALIAKCRQIMMPVLLKNVRREGMQVSKELMDKAASMFTEERCRELLTHARKTRQQMDARSLRIQRSNPNSPLSADFVPPPPHPPSPTTKRAREDDATSADLHGREKRGRYDNDHADDTVPPDSARTNVTRAEDNGPALVGPGTNTQLDIEARSVDPDSLMVSLVDKSASPPQPKDSKTATDYPHPDHNAADVIQEDASIAPPSGAAVSAAQRALDIGPSEPIPQSGEPKPTIPTPPIAKVDASPEDRPTTAQAGAAPAGVGVAPKKPVQDAWEPPDVTMGVPAFTRITPAQPFPVSVSEPIPPSAPLPPPPPQPFVSRVPGLWALHPGVSSPDIVDLSFEVDDETAAAMQRWSRRWDHFDASARHVVARLLCLPLAQVHELNAQIGSQTTQPTAAEVATSMAQIKTEWPLPNGSLVVQLNSEQEGGKTWFAPALMPDTPLDISEAMRTGMNALRLIQLADMSSFVFVLHASEPTKDDLAALDEHQAACKGYAEDGWAVSSSEFVFPLAE